MKKKYVCILMVWASILFAACPGYAQQFDIRNWTVMDGLPQAEVSAIAQDQAGYLWMATGSGLTRFDGKKFQTYSSGDGLRSNVVTEVFVDHEKKLWVATEGNGVCRMLDNRCHYLADSLGLAEATVYKIFEDRDQNLWFGTLHKGVMRWDGTRMVVQDTSSGLPSNTIWDVVQDSSGTVWLATDKGLASWKKGKVRSYESLDGLAGNKIYSLLSAAAGELFVGTDKGLTSLDTDMLKSAREVDFFKGQKIFDIEQNAKGLLWVGTDRMGVAFGHGNSWTRIKEENGLENEQIDDIFIDREQNVWIGTYAGGVSRYRFDTWRLYQPTHDVGVLSVHRTNEGQVWTGTTDGLYLYKKGHFSRHIMPGHNVWDIDELPNGHLLFFTDQDKIFELDGDTVRNYLDRVGRENISPYEMTVDREGGLWVGTRQGVWHILGKKIEHLTTDDGLPDNMVWRIYQDREGKMWFGTDRGVGSYANGEFHNLTIADGLPHNIVSDITQDADGDYWFGTDGGVAFFRPATDSTAQQLVSFDKQDGLRFLQTQFLQIDGQERLWQATNSGIQWFAINRFKHHSQYNWFPFQFGDFDRLEFNHRAAMENDDGQLLMGTMQGLLVIDAEKWHPKQTQVRMHVTQVENLMDAAQSRTTDDSFFTWKYNHNSLRFSYIGIDLSQPRWVKYRYRLKGFDRDWSAPTSLTSATYTNLDPGEYTFQVKASNGSGYWNIRPAEVHFRITAPFWRRWWFYTLLVIGLVGGGYGFISVRLKILERDKLKQLVREQTRSLEESLSEKEVLIKEVHHRVKNNLAVISGLLELQLQTIDDEEARHILGESQLRIHSIAKIHEKLYQNENLSSIPFDQYIRDLLEVIEMSVAYENPVELSLQVESVQLNVTQAIPCGLIMNELVTNAYEHAFDKSIEAPLIEIRFIRRDSDIIFEVADNGLGLPEDFDLGQLSSLGLSLVDTLTQQLEGTLRIEARKTGGTRFSITFPYG